MVVEKGWRRASLVEDEAEGQIDLGTRRRGGDLAFGIRSSNQKPQERSSTSVVRDPNHDLKWWSSTTGIWVGGKRVGVSPVDIRKEMVVLLVEVVGVRLRWGVREILGVVERVRHSGGRIRGGRGGKRQGRRRGRKREREGNIILYMYIYVYIKK
ncbi:hypothetical protein CDL15_Pgr018456 [Punica granatum]|uniref:Uncharacterized protein n=1 Tax=Punica granatum TaxID=22663 RepID=A0A218WYL1_PUNGR|nr:hypothetical protein CDL15_Pgr018456 [Punica granatum]